jgi:GDP/UDP-N,N'-diacetylbacillosamine 2-epimerase (hydrolysing)
MRKICVVTGSRAEYGLLRWVMEGINNDPDLLLQIIATGMHLSADFGLTYREIEKDGFQIDRLVEILTSSDSSVGIAKSIGLGLIGFADAFKELKPDLILVLGDRFEIFSAVSAALVAKIPVAHLHGGEKTVGAFDDALRHSITKMSHIHFVATESYRQRVIQLGEQPDHVFLVGGLGVDSIRRLNLLDRNALETELGFKLGRKNLLITFHPTTLGAVSAETQIEELFSALLSLEDTKLIFTLPNADTNSRALTKAVKKFVADHPNACAYSSLGQSLYLSCMAHVDGVVGNSSSGLLEAPTLRKGTINIGDRQEGRLQAKSIINCDPTRQNITNALLKLYSKEFQSSLHEVTNPYGDGGASEKVVAILKHQNIESITKKIFYDYPFGS